jgi:hypothetical protein
MQKKYGKFYPGWRNEKGKRHHRAFKSASDTRARQTAQRRKKNVPAPSQERIGSRPSKLSPG